MKLSDFDVFDCFFSGGRDSALTCYIAYKVSKVLNKNFRLIHIDTKIAISETKEYVKRYADWLNAELKIVQTQYDYFEFVKKYGYPSVIKNRWCWRFLKQEPLYQFKIEEIKEKINPLWILGIRRNESLFRLENYGKITNTLKRGMIKNLHVVEWLPILYLSGEEVDRLINKFKIPINPVWKKIGISGECLCLAGTTKKKLEALFINYPDIAQKFYEFDKSLIPKREGNLIPLGLLNDKKRLHKFIEEIQNKKNQPTIDEYFACQGACFNL
ncbi:putative phosphoadenosine phoshosulfate reductase [Sulfolobales Beppu rod-shaped virus 1]|uniref:Putative phosphoadenosine phoshosulfate reductase n=1 Tax=Sulfolobales Beppu rod-shaped virus 1 TaxID=2493121 RepID=A0A3Q8Q3Y9_9VIRU|nr:putative phosphoadenosine phoshosulfate reductase [Sulfolobales Beppu rod-shaped virus 1]AZI75912.1 putative phosphoadenosine phoshosulfate reductase [Sulfolobales Beppu rod-shaped virus 1]